MKHLRCLFAAAAILCASAPALAGPSADDMGKCLVNSTTSADKSALVQWMFTTMALHPDVAQFASVSAEERAAANRRFGDLAVDLLTKRCLEESRLAIKNEGMGVIETTFSLLGQVAAQELFANPKVAAGLADFGKLVDDKKLEPLTKDP